MQKGNWALMEPFVIAKDGSVYLRRMRIVQTPWFALYLHHIYRPDADRDMHDHPWNFGSLILRGGYSEVWTPTPQGLDGKKTDDQVFIQRAIARTWRRWSWHSVKTTEAHSIVSTEPRTVSLIFVGKRSRVWGFFTENGWMPWPEYIAQSTNPDPYTDPPL